MCDDQILSFVYFIPARVQRAVRETLLYTHTQFIRQQHAGTLVFRCLGAYITSSVGAVVACSFVELTISPCKFRPLHPVLSPSLYAVEGYIRPPTFASKSVMGRSCDRFRLAPRKAAAAVANSRSFECDLRCRYIRIHDAVFNRMHMAVCGAYVIYADDVAPDDRRCWRGVA